MARLRFDSDYGDNRPDRAEAFYAKSGAFGTPDAHGPPLIDRNVNYQEIHSYFEYAITPRYSVFLDVPFRFLQPQANDNYAGLSDISFGSKYAVIYSQKEVLSLQLTVITPTGETDDGLGTGVTWLEPAILYQRQMTDRWQVFGELKDQLYLKRQSDYTGNISTYGLGSSYVVLKSDWVYIAPVGEFVGWTVLSGKETDPNSMTAVSARGDTIVNAKLGVRIGLGSVQLGQPFPTKSDLYIGYGRALTGDVWYKQMFRVEFRCFF